MPFPSGALIPLLYFIQMAGFDWQMPKLIEKFQNEDFDKIKQNVCFYMVFDTMTVMIGDGFGLFGI